MKQTNRLGSQNLMSASGVLDQHVFIESRDIDDVTDKLAKFKSPHKITLLGKPQNLNVTYSGISLSGIVLMRARYGASICSEPDGDQFFYTNTVLQESCRISCKGSNHELSLGASSVLSPSAPYRIHLDENCDRLLMRIDPTKIQSYLSKVLCREITTEVEFVCEADISGTLLDTVQFLLSQITLEPAILENEEIKSAYSQMIIANLVMLYQHNFSTAIHQPAKAMLNPQIKSATDFIRTRIKHNISATDVACYCNVTLRTLQRSFLKHLNTTPTKYIRDVKLELVHDKLQRSAQQEKASVKQVLLDHGIIDFGRFASHYRKKYGCTPHETIKKQNKAKIFIGDAASDNNSLVAQISASNDFKQGYLF